MTPLPPSPFIDPDIPRFHLNEARFLLDILSEDDPPPAFISDPSQDYIKATEIRSILEVLGGHMR